MCLLLDEGTLVGAWNRSMRRRLDAAAAEAASEIIGSM